MNNADRELLELAALAARYWEVDGWSIETHKGMRWVNEERFFVRYWNPLLDDGDAFRLAVQLNISMDLCLWVQTAFYDVGAFVAEDWSNGGDAFAATRRAIVRAAAEIGRKMREEGII